MAVYGYGIAVVDQNDEKEALIVVGKKVALRIALENIVLNQQYMRWECEVKNVRENNGLGNP